MGSGLDRPGGLTGGQRVNYDVYEAPSFWDSARAIRRDDDYKAALMDTLIELRQQPFRNPKLHTHDVGRGINGKKVFSSDVGGRRSDRRLVWQIFDKTIVVLLYGTHAVQERAKRMKVAFDPAERVVSIYERAPDTGVERPYLAQRQEIGTLFMAWTDAELADLGFNEPTVKILRGLDTDEQLLALEDRLDGETFERAFNLVAYGNVQGRPPAPGPVEEADEPEVTDEDREIARQLEDVRAGGWFTQTEPAFLAEVLTRPIEDWMIFLHPD